MIYEASYEEILYVFHFNNTEFKKLKLKVLMWKYRLDTEYCNATDGNRNMWIA